MANVTSLPTHHMLEIISTNREGEEEEQDDKSIKLKKEISTIPKRKIQPSLENRLPQLK